jgi:hypothetical protein
MTVLVFFREITLPGTTADTDPRHAAVRKGATVEGHYRIGSRAANDRSPIDAPTETTADGERDTPPMRTAARHRRGHRIGVQSLRRDRPPIRCRRPEPRPMRTGGRHRREE